MKKPTSCLPAYQSSGRKTLNRVVSAHLWEIRETPFTRQSHTTAYNTTQQLYDVPIRQAFRKWKDNIAFI